MSGWVWALIAFAVLCGLVAWLGDMGWALIAAVLLVGLLLVPNNSTPRK